MTSMVWPTYNKTVYCESNGHVTDDVT